MKRERLNKKERGIHGDCERTRMREKEGVVRIAQRAHSIKMNPKNRTENLRRNIG